jgi:hypothetical protein
MKRTILIILISGLFISSGITQKLLDIYKIGPVKLVPDKTYGARNNWESLFNLYFDTLNSHGRSSELDKKIIVTSDGSVFMTHHNRYEIWKFGSDGTFIRKFGSKGGKPDQFPMRPDIRAEVSDKYIFTSDVNGRLKFFDLDGNYFKSLTLKYIATDFCAMSNGEISLKGFVIWKSNIRNIIVKLNIYTGKEDIVFDYFTDRGIFLTADNVDSLINSVKSKHNIRLPGNSFFSSRPVVTLLKDGQVIISNSETGEMKIYNSNGNGIINSKMDIKPIAISEADVKENYEKMRQNFIREIDDFKKSPSASGFKQKYININQKFLDNSEIYNNIKNYYPFLPYFSNIILDDEGNLLVFEFTKKEDAVSNIFNVIAYDISGKKLARTSFICDDYDLSFSESTFVISKGYVYAVAKLKNYRGMPLRLVKLKITN